MATEGGGETLKKLYCFESNNPNIAEQAGEFYSVEVVLKKGLGLIAAKDILRGRQIIEENVMVKFAIDTFGRALATVPTETIEALIKRKIQALPEEKQKVFYSLHNARDARSPHIGRLLTNAFQLDNNQKGVFRVISRINHSCYPNCHFSWNPRTCKGSLFSIRKTFKGEELTISYCQEGPSEVRQRKLKEDYGFRCKCKICRLKTPDLNASNLRCLQILQLLPRIADADRLINEPELALKDVYDLLKLYEGEDITDGRLVACLRRAFEIHIFHGDLARARFFAERMHQETVVCDGLEHPLTVQMRDLMNDPRSAPMFRRSERWKLAKKEVPELLEGERDFEQWLWARTGVTDPESFPPEHIDYIP